LDLSELKGIISLMQKSDLTELEIELKDLKLRMARPGAGSFQRELAKDFVVQANVPLPSTASNPQPEPSKKPAEENLKTFESPMVGTFYRKPSPDDPSFVKEGDAVKKGDTLCIIEAMKVMNEIQSEFTGEIAEILVEDGSSVEFGQPLFKFRQ